MSSAAPPTDLLAELSHLLPPGSVNDDIALRQEFSVQGIVPEVIAFPQDAAEVARVLAHANAGGLIVVPSGGHSQQHIGNVPERIDIILSLSKLTSVNHFDPGDLTIGVGAGMRIGDLNSKLAEHQQWVPFDLVDDRQTVGGLLASGTQGPLRALQPIRDLCIGIEFVTPDGKIAHAGGRVVKNVAGYDLMKIMVGSFGSLGVITAASFKVLPRPRQTRTFVLEFESQTAAVEYALRTAKSPLHPLCLDLLSPRALEYIERDDHVRDADHYAPSHTVPLSSNWKIALRAAGSGAVLDRYRRDLGESVTSEASGPSEDDWWSRITRFERRALREHRNLMSAHCVFPSSKLQPALHAIESSAIENNLLPAIAARPAVGVAQIAFVPLSVDPPSAMQYASTASALRAALPEGSFATIVRCPPEAKMYFDVWGNVTPDLRCQKKLQEEMDPKRILNRGRSWLA